MNNQSRFVPTYAAFGGEPQYIQTPYGLVKNDASYKKYLAEKENATGLVPDKNKISVSPQSKNSSSVWNKFQNWGNDFADMTQAAVIGYTTGTTLGNFDEGMGSVTAILSDNPHGYTMGRDVVRQMQNDLSQHHPYIYKGMEMLGAATMPLHFFEETSFVNKAGNALTDTLNSSVGYAENLKDFGLGVISNGIANGIELSAEKLPMYRAIGIGGRKAFSQGIGQGINYLTDKAKNMFYIDDN